MSKFLAYLVLMPFILMKWVIFYPVFCGMSIIFGTIDWAIETVSYNDFEINKRSWLWHVKEEQELFLSTFRRKG